VVNLCMVAVLSTRAKINIWGDVLLRSSTSMCVCYCILIPIIDDSPCVRNPDSLNTIYVCTYVTLSVCMNQEMYPHSFASHSSSILGGLIPFLLRLKAGEDDPRLAPTCMYTLFTELAPTCMYTLFTELAHNWMPPKYLQACILH